ncbi:MAG: hypothetical protein CL607_21220 [Anaerolineaceae bacterium]|nr:hypothetical protein [Anaerolineaceae bacterium]
MKTTRTIQVLLAYIMLQRHRLHPREVLLDLFWSDRPIDSARSCLNTAIWRLRAVLEPEGIQRGTYLISNNSGEIGFNQDSEYWLDVAEFEAEAMLVLTKPEQLLDASDVQRLEQVLALYVGDLLDNFYDDWALSERARLHRIYMDSLVCLMLYHAQDDNCNRSLEYGRQILHHDPLREDIYREIMRLHMMNGQRALAIQTYHECAEMLQRQLGIQPMSETQAMYEWVANAQHNQASISTDVVIPVNITDYLTSAKASIELAQQQLAMVMQFIEETSNHNS